MTEVERILSKGILPKDFCQPETLCDFYVDEKRKKIWAIGIDLLIRFDKLCRKHGLRYSVSFGSLLGIIRHHGFIPWDDDVDVVMPRTDYERLKLYRSEIEEPYYLQYPGEDNGYFFSIAKLRNSNTTCISKPFRYESFNQGQCLDIFPLDNFNESNIDYNIEKIKLLIAECSALMRRSNPRPDEVDIAKMSRFPVVRNGKNVIKELEALLNQYNNQPSEKYTAWCCVMYDYTKMTFYKEIFDDLIETDFYGYPVYIPRHYDKALKVTYGNYMEFPPVNKRGVWHATTIFEPDIPYKETLRIIQSVEGY